MTKSLVAVLSAFCAAFIAQAWAEETAPPAVAAADLGGIVTSANGPEAGAWVIAETTELATRYVKIVVTDDKGRYVVPDLPAAHYDVWVRGYGLMDSPKVVAVPGKILNLRAVAAPSASAAAQYYPADYWFSLLHFPDRSLFPGTGPKGNLMPEKLKSQGQWIAMIKSLGCGSCHQLGNLATRTIPPGLGTFKTSLDAWERRVQSGPAAQIMARNLGDLDTGRALKLFADWTDRIAAGTLPASKPPRPQGIERNIVVTLWDWSDPKAYLHDAVSTDKRDPTVNAYGEIYGAPEDSTDMIPVLDPVHNVTHEFKLPVRDADTPAGMFIAADPGAEFAPSRFWGDENIWSSQASAHNPMFDEKGRVWFTSRIRKPANPPFCKAQSALESARAFPLNQAGRQLSMYDPTTGKVALIDTCFSTHHLVFAEDKNDTLWTSSGGGAGDVVGWLDVKKFEATGDAASSQGWTALVLDTNGNGNRDDAVEPEMPVDPAKDKRIRAAFYGIGVSPVDGSVWGSVLAFPGAVVRLLPGDDPPKTALAEYYEVPWNDPRAPVNGYAPRGMDIDRDGVVWTPLASGHLASFDRRKCKGPLNGPLATGRHCPEGWTLYPFPGPKFDGDTQSGSAESSYQAWVDQFDTFGLGSGVPFVTGNNNDALEALVDGKWITLRVPYPMGFFAKGIDGRIDDAKAGWKGRGLWSAYGGRATAHIEGGKGTLPKVVHFQLRPDPLAD